MDSLEQPRLGEQPLEERALETSSPACDCSHERLSDGVHHYLELSGATDGDSGRPLAIDDSLERQEGNYIAVAFTEGASFCFLRPTWAATFRGPSEAGEIPPSLRLLCDWCKGHWSSAPDINFRSL